MYVVIAKSWCQIFTVLVNCIPLGWRRHLAKKSIGLIRIMYDNTLRYTLHTLHTLHYINTL